MKKILIALLAILSLITTNIERKEDNVVYAEDNGNVLTFRVEIDVDTVADLESLGITLEGAEFTVYNQKDNSAVGVFVLDKYGRGHVGNINGPTTMNIAENGTYKIVETVHPYGFKYFDYKEMKDIKLFSTPILPTDFTVETVCYLYGYNSNHENFSENQHVLWRLVGLTDIGNVGAFECGIDGAKAPVEISPNFYWNSSTGTYVKVNRGIYWGPHTFQISNMHLVDRETYPNIYKTMYYGRYKENGDYKFNYSSYLKNSPFPSQQDLSDGYWSFYYDGYGANTTAYQKERLAAYITHAALNRFWGIKAGRTYQENQDGARAFINYVQNQSISSVPDNFYVYVWEKYNGSASRPEQDMFIAFMTGTSNAHQDVVINYKAMVDPYYLQVVKEGESSTKLAGAQFKIDYYKNFGTPVTTRSGLNSLSLTKTWTFESKSTGLVQYANSYKVAGDDLYTFNYVPVMPAGTYVITEIKAPENYFLADPFLLTVELNAENTDYIFKYYDLDGNSIASASQNGLSNKTVVDERYGKLKFLKESTIPEVSEYLPLAGTEFWLYTDAAGTQLAYAYNETTEEFDIPAKFIVGNDNQTQELILRPGTYYWVEKVGPNGYEQPSQTPEEIYVPITLSDTDVTVKKVANIPQSGKVRIYKRSADPDYGLTHSLAGTIFTLYTDAACTQPASGYKFIIGQDGYSNVIELPLAITYYYKETSVPDDYFKDETIKSFTLTASDIQTIKVIEETNAPKGGKAKLIKTSSSAAYASDYPLEGAVYKIFTADGINTNKLFITDENGVSNEVELPAGNYYCVEDAAPWGYSVDNTHINFTVGALATVTVNAVDHPNREKLYLDKRYAQPSSGSAPAGNSTTVYTQLTNYTDLFPYVNANYTVYSNETSAQNRSSSDIVGVLVTNTEGRTNTLELEVGNYWVIETVAPTGYALDNTVYPITLNTPGETYSFTAYEEGNYSKLQIYKSSTDAAFQASHSVAGATYGLFTDSACTSASLYATLEIQDDGYSQVALLPAGTYYLKEMTPAPGYALDETVYTINAAASYQVLKKVVDQPNVGFVQLNKRYSGSTAYVNDFPLAGAKYMLYFNGQAGDTADASSGAYVSNPTGWILETDANGNTQTLEVSRGVYYIKEIEAPNGWVLDTHVYRIEATGSDTATLTVEELPEFGKIKIKKTDTNGVPISGVSFIVSGTSVFGKPVYKKVTTDANGLIDAYIPYGTYSLVEDYDASLGLVQITDTMSVTISDSTTRTVVAGKSNDGDYAVITNERMIIQTIEFVKANTSHVSLPGAYFNLTGVSDYGTVIDMGATSDGSGLVQFTNIPKGTYTLREMIAPDGYKVDSTPRTVVVSASGVTITPSMTYSGHIEIQNQKTYSLKILKKNTRDDSLSGAEFTLTGKSASGTMINIIKTTSNGTLTFDGLEVNAPGEYYILKETAAPEGYRELPGQYKVYVSDSGVTVEGVDMVGDYYLFVNQPQGKEITIVKRWIDNTTDANRPPLVFHVSNYEYGKYNILYVANGGEGTMAEQDVEDGNSVIISNNAFTRTGYTFTGWGLGPNSGANAAYAPGTSITPTSHLVLYAQWRPITYTVHFDKNNAQARGTMSDQTFTYDVAQALNPNQFWLGYNE